MTASCQQDAVCDAERSVDPGRIFESTRDVQKFVDELRETSWWENYLQNVVRVEVGPTRRGATHSVGWYEPNARAGRMEFNVRKPSTRLVLHELAHVFAGARHCSRSHDPWWARVHYELTYHVRGSNAAQQLKDAYDRNGINYDADGLA